MKSLVYLSVIITTLISISAQASEISMIETQVNEAELIVKGTVSAIELGASIEGIPHTFVTFSDLTVYNGVVDGDEVTLRFAGGPYNEGTKYFFFDRRMPLFDIGETSILFVHNNTEYACPLVNCQYGRYRLSNGYIYSELGQELAIDDDENIIIVTTTPVLAEANEFHVPGTDYTFTKESSSAENFDLLPPLYIGETAANSILSETVFVDLVNSMLVDSSNPSDQFENADLKIEFSFEPFKSIAQ